MASIKPDLDQQLNDYEFTEQEIALKLSDVCQGGLYQDQISAIASQIQRILQQIGIISEKGDEDDEDSGEDDDESEEDEKKYDKEELLKLV